MIRPLKIAVIFDQKLHDGGGFQQALNLAVLVSKIEAKVASVSFYTIIKSNIKALNKLNIKAEYLPLNKLKKFFIYSKTDPNFYFFANIIEKFLNFRFFEKKFIKDKVDLIFFVSPSRLAGDLSNINFIYTMLDTCHKDYPEFPEVSNSSQFETRELTYKTILPKATAIISESYVSKNKISTYYSIEKERINVIPLGISPTLSNLKISISEKEKYFKDININKPYIFYPAQFWAHKNHVFILEALKMIEIEYGKKISAVFSGVDKGNLKYVKKYAKRINFNNVYFLGFVSPKELKILYENSLALVMPSYFGPSNIPPIEALSFGLPVFYPNLPGAVEQLGDAFIEIDLTDPMKLAIKLNKLITDNEFRKNMINKGRKQLISLSKFDNSKTLIQIVENFRHKISSWDGLED